MTATSAKQIQSSATLSIVCEEVSTVSSDLPIPLNAVIVLHPRPISPVLSLHGEEETDDAWFEGYNSVPNQLESCAETLTIVEASHEPSSLGEDLLLAEDPSDGRLPLAATEQPATGIAAAEGPEAIGTPLEREEENAEVDTGENCVSPSIPSSSPPQIATDEYIVEILVSTDEREGSKTPDFSEGWKATTPDRSPVHRPKLPRTEAQRAHEKARRSRRRRIVSRYAAAAIKKEAHAAIDALRKESCDIKWPAATQMHR